MTVAICTWTKYPSKTGQHLINFGTNFSREAVTFLGFYSLAKTWCDFRIPFPKTLNTDFESKFLFGNNRTFEN